MSKAQRMAFQNFISRFEEVALPISIGTETHLDFSSMNTPLPVDVIEAFFIETGVMEELDEFTELVPVMKIPNTNDFIAIIVWKAGLLAYDYFLLTYNKMGELLDKKTIAGTKVIENVLLHAVVTINERWEIHVMQNGRAADDEYNFDPTKTLRYQYQILEDGYIQEEEPDDVVL